MPTQPSELTEGKLVDAILQRLGTNSSQSLVKSKLYDDEIFSAMKDA